MTSLTVTCPCGAGPAHISEPVALHGERVLAAEVTCERGHVHRWFWWAAREAARRLRLVEQYLAVAREMASIAAETRDPEARVIALAAARRLPRLAEEVGRRG